MGTRKRERDWSEPELWKAARPRPSRAPGLDLDPGKPSSRKLPSQPPPGPHPAHMSQPSPGEPLAHMRQPSSGPPPAHMWQPSSPSNGAASGTSLKIEGPLTWTCPQTGQTMQYLVGRVAQHDDPPPEDDEPVVLYLAGLGDAGNLKNPKEVRKRFAHLHTLGLRPFRFLAPMRAPGHWWVIKGDDLNYGHLGVLLLDKVELLADLVEAVAEGHPVVSIGFSAGAYCLTELLALGRPHFAAMALGGLHGHGQPDLDEIPKKRREGVIEKFEQWLARVSNHPGVAGGILAMHAEDDPWSPKRFAKLGFDAIGARNKDLGFPRVRLTVLTSGKGHKYEDEAIWSKTIFNDLFTAVGWTKSKLRGSISLVMSTDALATETPGLRSGARIKGSTCRWLPEDAGDTIVEQGKGERELQPCGLEVELDPIVFVPGAIGMNANWTTGEIIEILPDGQAELLGIKKGWRLHKLEGANGCEPYTEARLDELIDGSETYLVTFIEVVRPEASDSEELDKESVDSSSDVQLNDEDLMALPGVGALDSEEEILEALVDDNSATFAVDPEGLSDDWRYTSGLCMEDIQVEVTSSNLPGELPDWAVRASEIFKERGFVVLLGALSDKRATKVCADCLAIARSILDDVAKPQGNRHGGARYSFGKASSTGSLLHLPSFARYLLDNTAVITTLQAISALSTDEAEPSQKVANAFKCVSAGGDFVLAGERRFQRAHNDLGCVSKTSNVLLPTPLIAANFCVEHISGENGPMRMIPGTQLTQGHWDSSPEEPPEWRGFRLFPLPAGAVILRDVRTLHGGSPNFSEKVRFLPAVEFASDEFLATPRGRTYISHNSMPRALFDKLRSSAKRIVHPDVIADTIINPTFKNEVKRGAKRWSTVATRAG